MTNKIAKNPNFRQNSHSLLKLFPKTSKLVALLASKPIGTHFPAKTKKLSSNHVTRKNSVKLRKTYQTLNFSVFNFLNVNHFEWIFLDFFVKSLKRLFTVYNLCFDISITKFCTKQLLECYWFQKFRRNFCWRKSRNLAR